MINVTYVGDHLIAYKVTGDHNIPRGEVTFTADLSPTDSTGSTNDSNGPSALDPIVLSEASAKKWGTKRYVFMCPHSITVRFHYCQPSLVTCTAFRSLAILQSTPLSRQRPSSGTRLPKPTISRGTARRHWLRGILLLRMDTPGTSNFLRSSFSRTHLKNAQGRRRCESDCWHWQCRADFGTGEHERDDGICCKVF